MRRFSEEEIKELSSFELNFKTAVKSNYKRATIRKNDLRIKEIAEATGMNGLTNNFGCGSCSLNFYKQVGNKYFQDKEYWENKAAEDEVVDMVMTMAEKKKPGRKKSNKKENKE